MFINKTKPFFYIGILYLIISFIVRIIFFLHPITTTSFNFFEIIKTLAIGTIIDSFVFVICSCFLSIYFLFLSNTKYKTPYGYIIFVALVLFLLYTLFYPNNIFMQYGGVVPEIAASFIGLKAALFGLMLFLPTQRKNIRNILYFITVFIYVLLIIFNAVSEYFFWNEFGLRYNFIAVDYLIYTNEVIGNIMESYPILPLFSSIFVFTVLATIFIYKKTKDSLIQLPNFSQKLILLSTYILIFFVSLFCIDKLSNLSDDNVFRKEIQANGFPKFYEAFTQKELDYFRFYPSLPQSQAEKIVFNKRKSSSLLKDIKNEGEEQKKNVVLISVESLSAEFMKMYGNTQNVTPFLDSLAEKSLTFTNLYATGNRTVRGLEALTLSIPPTAGESTVKRINNKDKFTIGHVFKSKGYQIKYLYGGYSYFDNMKDFFGGNNYEIIDRDHFSPEEISFANVWGVADEDMAKKAISVMNSDAKNGKPFFHHWMTVSNHRPFTYPEGRIDIPGTAKSRDGGVKYTDYSIKKFFELAKKESWYKNTIFVIVADHCASSAGRTELPLERYRIPGLIFSEGYVEPRKYTQLMSQIDVMPTLLGILNFNYKSKFLGYDVLKSDYSPRAYIATYQDLGYIKDNILTVISPTKRARQYSVKEKPNDNPNAYSVFYEETPIDVTRKDLVDECISSYQMTSFWLKNNMLNK